MPRKKLYCKNCVVLHFIFCLATNDDNDDNNNNNNNNNNSNNNPMSKVYPKCIQRANPADTGLEWKAIVRFPTCRFQINKLFRGIYASRCRKAALPFLLSLSFSFSLNFIVDTLELYANRGGIAIKGATRSQ